MQTVEKTENITMKSPIPPIILTELETSGAPYTLERGTRHWKLFVNGIFCAIFPISGKVKMTGLDRGLLNLRSQVRKAIRGQAPSSRCIMQGA
jgi:hypothetical protein